MNLPGPLPFQCVWHCVLFLSQAAVIQRSGHRDVLGHTPKGYWETMELNCGRPKPPSLQTLPLHLYGDECQAWQGTQLMCFHWMSEVSPLQKDAAKSRFLIACIPTSYYWKEGLLERREMQSDGAGALEANCSEFQHLCLAWC